MFVILVYDIGEKRVGKILKATRKYLHWVQNSVFEGEISDANFKKLKHELSVKMDKDEDSVIIYTFRTTKYTERQIIGVEKNPANFML
ncbi:MAG: CRISPR-associated endonuclease Cas2 [Clostridiaceae bacterium]|nr:CRISPR-associated endonuclease Cas2 [Clostridiaceae bacterium]